MDDTDGFTRPLPTVAAEVQRVSHERRSAILAAERREQDARNALTDATRYRRTADMRMTQLNDLLDELHRANLDDQATHIPDLAAQIDSIEA